MCANRQNTCLCDVSIVAKTEILNIDFARDSYHGQAICEYLNLSVPWTDKAILDFFEAQVRVKDEMAVLERAGRPNHRCPSKITDQARQLLARLFAAEATNSFIRAEVKRVHGIELTSSHVSHLR